MADVKTAVSTRDWASSQKKERVLTDNMKTLCDYMNYREFLRDYYEEKKRIQSFFSFRLFSQKAGFKAPNVLKLVIEGKRNLSKESVFKFCKALDFNKKECEYFENLVFFNQAKTLEEKKLYLTTIMKHRSQAETRVLEQSQYEYFSQWYHPVIRELVCADDFANDFKRIGKMVVPSISEHEVVKSVELLEQLGFIQKDRTDAGYRKTSVSLTTGHTVRSIAAANFHKKMMALASNAIERFSSRDRDIESVTINVSSKTYQAVLAKTHEYMMEVLRLAESDKQGSKIVQVNVQVFPLSKTYRLEKDPQ